MNKKPNPDHHRLNVPLPQDLSETLDLSSIEPVCRPQAIQSFQRKDGRGFASSGYSTGSTLVVVRDNMDLLIQEGIFEEALFGGFIGSKSNNRNIPLREVKRLLTSADRQRLRQCGDELQEDAPCTVYRGACGPSNRRRILGYSWTTCLSVACSFANGWGEPAVYQLKCDSEDVYFATNERDENEVVVIPKRSKVSQLYLTCQEFESHLLQMEERRKARHAEMRKRMLEHRRTANSEGVDIRSLMASLT